MLRFVLAFLLHNGLLSGGFISLPMAIKSLQNTIVAFFVWHRGMGLLLDWYHLTEFIDTAARAVNAPAAFLRFPYWMLCSAPWLCERIFITLGWSRR